MLIFQPAEEEPPEVKMVAQNDAEEEYLRDINPK